MSKLFLTLGALNAMLCVMLGAFGAHALKARLGPELLATWHTAVQYHFFHALGLLAVGMLLRQMPDARGVVWAGWLMLVGVLLFSGSLYALCLSGIRTLGAITPLGGVAFIAAWALLAWATWRS
ncbi:MAG: DUF423 domain-containing protein [Burkholderiales bacterium]|nr:DUF423 domain-containing protein [Burkholderiales bacterium]